jgi:hypothetical protein
MSAAERPRRHSNAPVTVAHMDDAISARILIALEPVQDDLDDLRNDVNGLRVLIVDALQRLDKRPVRRVSRWFIHEAHTAWRTGVAAAIGACAAYATAHFF